MTTPDHVDVLIVGAGLSGIGAAHHLQRALPRQELRDPRGAERPRRHLGPVPLPGHPLGLRHAHARLPVQALDDAKAIADGPSILEYVRRRRPARTGSRSRSASTTGSSRREWSIGGRALDGRGRAHRRRARGSSMTCDFLFMCTGYYRYDEGYTPEFPGLERFGGQVVHPQHWPEDLDYDGKRVVVIGSGATAVTLVPAMAEEAAQVTMLQRSPTYVISMPGEDPIAERLRKRLPDARRLSRSCAGRTSCCSRLLSAQPPPAGRDASGPAAGSDRERCRPATTSTRHFNPTLQPLGPADLPGPGRRPVRGDLHGGTAEVATDTIETLRRDRHRARLRASGCDADIIVTATGLNLQLLGGIDVDRRRRGDRRSPRPSPTRG